jgi:glycogen(starch) synthase
MARACKGRVPARPGHAARIPVTARGGLPRVSVVISTYNRAAGLRNTLDGLRRQTYDDFEVIVVNGPSTDDTAAVLEAIPDVRSLSCADTHLSRSRNIGIAASAGDVVAFIDDDAIPESNWVAGLAAAYGDDTVGGAGGLVFDHTGAALQYRYSVSDRTGRTRFDCVPPLDRYLGAGADPFLYLQGTNCSFRRDVLAEIGGFDDEIEYNLDEVEVCLQVIDTGRRLVALDGAAVHHRYLASHLRNEKRLVLRPFLQFKNRVYFAMLHGRETRTTTEVIADLQAFADELRDNVRSECEAGNLTEEEVAVYIGELESGFEVGLRRGLTGSRVRTTIPPADPSAFVPFGVLSPESGRVSICLLSQEYPPEPGGVGRATADLAAGLAEMGHEVHVITRTPDLARVDVEDGVWMHRIVNRDRGVIELAGHPLAHNLNLLSNLYHEARSLDERIGVDLLLWPLWLSEGAICDLDDRWASVCMLQTSMRQIVEIQPSKADDEHARGMQRLEEATLRRARLMQANSEATRQRIATDFGVDPVLITVVPLGIRDRRGEVIVARRAPDTVELLFVGRLERRKGADVLLEALPALLDDIPDLHVTLAGPDTLNTETEETYRAAFVRRRAQRPDVLARVDFLGHVDDDELYRLFASCDVMCAPSRYESFGLVLIEAMQFGKPVVGTDEGGMREIVEDGASGRLARPGDAASLAECLHPLLVDARLRARMGKRSREIFAARYTRQRFAQGMLTAFAGDARVKATRTAPARDEAIRSRLAGLLVEVADVPMEQASAAAHALLEPPDEAASRLVDIRRIWRKPPSEFVTRLHRLLLGRSPTAHELAVHVPALEAGRPRAEIIEQVARSPESLARNGPPDWLELMTGLVDQERGRSVEALWAAPAETFLSGVYDALAGRPPTRSEWITGKLMLESGAARIAIARAANSAGRPADGSRVMALLETRLRGAARDPRLDELRQGFLASDEDFVGALYRVILQREADPVGREHALQRLRAGDDRGLLLHDVALSDEALDRRADISVLLGLEASARRSRSALPAFATAGLGVVYAGVARIAALGGRRRRRAR